MVKSLFDKIIPYVFLLFVFWTLTTFSLYVYHEYTTPVEDNVVTLNVVGIVNGTNATTLVSTQFECIKFCGQDLHYASAEAIRNCMDQCIKLGVDQC